MAQNSIVSYHANTIPVALASGGIVLPNAIIVIESLLKSASLVDL